MMTTYDIKLISKSYKQSLISINYYQLHNSITVHIFIKASKLNAIK